MALTRIMVSQQANTGLSKDRYVNTLYVESPTAIPSSDGQGIVDIIETFFNDEILVPSQQNPVSRYLAAAQLVASGNDTTVKLYRMEEPEKRVPFFTGQFDMAAFGVDALPEEVAVCMSYRAAVVSGQPAARRRGRIFLGPLNKDAIGTYSGDLHARPNNLFINALIAGAQRMAAQFVALGYHWVVHSPTTGPTAASQIVEVSVDNAFDTQRRRGAAPTARISGAIAV